MAKNTTTIAFNGNVTLADYATALRSFHHLMDSLSNEVALDAKVKWFVESLEYGSCIATCRGESTLADAAPVGTVVRAYEDTARALMKNKPIPFSSKVRKAARDLAKMTSTSIQSIRFETDEFDAEISGSVLSDEPQYETRFGAVTGRVQSISSRQTLRFTLYDELDDHAISCYLKSGSEDLMREAWGHSAVVEGTVRRHVVSGRVSTVRQVVSVSIIDEGRRDDFLDAIGCAPAVPGSISPEEAIRKIRDA